MDHDLRLTRKDSSVRYLHIYDRPTPRHGDVVTLPIDGKLIKASVKASVKDSPEGPETAIAADAEAIEI
jgi:hypothetical protein